jgi:hypothetical protein
MKNIFHTKYFLLALLIVPILISAKGDKDKIPITTSSEEAKQDFIKGRDLAEKLKVNESLKYLDNAIAKD